MIALNKILVDQRTPIFIQHGRKRAQVFPQAHGGGGVAYEVEAFGGGVLWHFGELWANSMIERQKCQKINQISDKMSNL